MECCGPAALLPGSALEHDHSLLRRPANPLCLQAPARAVPPRPSATDPATKRDQNRRLLYLFLSSGRERVHEPHTRLKWAPSQWSGRTTPPPSRCPCRWSIPGLVSAAQLRRVAARAHPDPRPELRLEKLLSSSSPHWPSHRRIAQLPLLQSGGRWRRFAPIQRTTRPYVPDRF